MKKYAALLLTFSILMCASTVPAYAADKAPPKAAKKMEHIGEAELKIINDRGKAAEEHNRVVLATLIGDWDYTVDFWPKPGKEAFRTTGMVTNEMVLEGRFLSSNISGNLNVAGHDTAIKAQGLIGYDVAKKGFTSVWVDTLNAGMMVGNGKYDEKSKVINETGRFTDPMDGVEKPYRSELKITDGNSYKRTIFAVNKGKKEAKLMEFEYVRKN